MKNAYFTLATDDYALGAYCLAKSINKVSRYNLHVLDLDISEEKRSLLRSVGCTLVPITGTRSRNSKILYYRRNPKWCDNCYNKIYLWKQEFDKIIYLDSDAVVLKDIDHLFELKEDFTACGTFQTKYCPQTKRLIGADWADNYFNGGVLVLKPSMDVYQELFIMKDTLETPKDPSDQGLLNHYFKGRWGKLKPFYNFPKRAFEVDPGCWERYKDKIFILHYTIDQPWSPVNQAWWSIYNS